MHSLQILDVKTLNVADVESNYSLLLVKIRMKIKLKTISEKSTDGQQF